MIIVSKEKFLIGNSQYMDYDEFVEKAFSEEGLDISGTLYININDMSRQVYEAARESDKIKFFTSNRKVPNWANPSEIHDWYEKLNNTKKEEEVLKSDPIYAEEIPIINHQSESYPKLDADVESKIGELLGDFEDETEVLKQKPRKGRIIVFGSSKGGTGKTFTSIISTYRYAKMHPNEKIALIDFDIIDGQVGISIHKIRPTIRMYYNEYQKGYDDYEAMKRFSVKANPPYPQNVDFFLAPSNSAKVVDDEFWLNVIKNCVENYDVVVFDTGIDYLNLKPISDVYKMANKVIIITTTSIKSVNSVTKQIGRLKGEIPSPNFEGKNVFSKKDDIASKLNIVITQMLPKQETNRTIYNKLSSKSNVIATFGVITESVSRAEFYGEWDVFDRNQDINKTLDRIMS